LAATRELVDDESVEASPDVDPARQDTPVTGPEDNSDLQAAPDDDDEESEGLKAEGDTDKSSKTGRWRPAAKAARDHLANIVRGRRRWIRSAIRWTAVLVFVAVSTGAGYEGWLLFQQHEQDVAAQRALDAARKYAVTLTSTDPNAIDQNFTEVLNGATDDFKDKYAKAGSRLRKLLIDNKVATHGSVVDSAVKSATKNEVEVLLFVRQSVSNSTSPDPHTDLTAVRVTMKKVGDRWLASKVVLPAEQGQTP
jgi:Mce-associated membrane protein